jgi:glycosyltransferase involved in cell wall biosynthesis
MAQEMGLTGNPAGARPSIAVLLCAMRGQDHLHEQLDSILAQSHPPSTVWVSDDGSDDGTLAILGDYQRRLGASRFSICRGPGKGYVANFLSIACNPQVTADYYAFSDQDDVWEADKIASALEWLQTIPSHVPALYCGRTRSVDASNQPIGFSPLFARQPSFANALVQSIAGGNTMVFNQAACRLLRLAGAGAQVASHDWWMYLLVSGCGGRVYYDPRPTVRYRQHAANLIGSNSHWGARLRRMGLLFRGRFSDWNDVNLVALEAMRAYLTPENQCRLDAFSQARRLGFFGRLAGIKRSGVYRQTLFGNIGLLAAVLCNKI